MISARESHRATAVETALADLERALCRDRCHVVVSASTGPAKTLLLGALAARVAGVLRVIPLPAVDPGDDPCAPILRELGETCGEDAEASLVAVVRRLASQGSALALVAGEAQALPEPLLRRLGRLCALARPGLRLVLVAEAGSDRDAIARFMAPLGIGAVKVSLDGPPQRAASGDRPAPSAPPRVGAHADAMRPRAIRVSARRGHTRRPARVALVGVAVAALGLVAADRIELPAWRAVAPPRAHRAQSAPHPAPTAAARRPVVAEAIAPVELAPVALAVANAEVLVEPVTPIHVAAADPAPATVEPAALEAPAEPVVAPEAPVEPVPPEATAEPEESPVPTVRVSLNAQPWAHIAIDGRDVGVTPMADLELTEGPHRFRARFPDGRVMERTLRVDAVRDHLSFP